MLTDKQVQDFISKWYSFEEIEDIKKWLQEIEAWNTISADTFWKQIYENINAKMKKNA